MAWVEVPDAVVTEIEELAGSAVASVEGSPLGFSPGFAGLVDFADGSRLFLKVMSAARDPWSIEFNRREARVVQQLPAQVQAPSLRWVIEQGDWLVLAYEAIDGVPAEPTADPAHREAMWRGFNELAMVAAPADLPAFHEYQADVMCQWRALADAPDRAARIASLGADGAWVEANLSRLLAWEHDAIEASQGDRLVHGDVRADNVIVAGDTAVFVDWPHASRGAPWLDFAGYLPSYEMYGGGSASEAFRAHPLSESVSTADERAFVAALAGYFTVQSTEPPMAAIHGIREFQRAQAIPALTWLRELAD